MEISVPQLPCLSVKAKTVSGLVIHLQHVQPAMHEAAVQPRGNSRDADTRCWRRSGPQ